MTLTSNSEVHSSHFTFAPSLSLIALTLTGYLHSAWREVSRVLAMVIAAFAVWSFIRFLRIADERQARINYQALGFAFILCPRRLSSWWIREGIWRTSCFLVGDFGVATHSVESWSDRLFLAVPMKTRLRVLRAEVEWSQAELATRVGVTRQTINAIETGRYDPSLPLAIKIARLFGKHVEEIFLDQESEPVTSANIKI